MALMRPPGDPGQGADGTGACQNRLWPSEDGTAAPVLAPYGEGFREKCLSSSGPEFRPVMYDGRGR